MVIARLVKVTGVVAALAAGAALTAPAAAASAGTAGTSGAAGDTVQKVRLYELVTPGNKGFFYTASASEKEAAISKHGFKPTQTPLPSVSKTAFPGSAPLYRLRYKAAASYIVSHESEARKLAASGKFVLEGVIGHIGQRRSGGSDVGLWRLAHQGRWRLAVTGHKDKILADETPAWQLDGKVGDAWGPWINSDN